MGWRQSVTDHELEEIEREIRHGFEHVIAILKTPAPPTPTPVTGIRLVTLREDTSMPLQISDSGNGATYAFTEEDAKGNPEATDVGTAAWSVSDPSILTVEPAADGFSAVVNAVGPIGTATVSVAVTVTNADGSTFELDASDDVTVVAGPPSQIALTGTVNP